MSTAAPPEGLPSATRYTIIALLLTAPNRTWEPKEIQRLTGFTYGVVRGALEALFDSRRIVKVPGKRKGRYHVRLTSTGVECCTAWIAQHSSTALINAAKSTVQGRAIIEAFTVATLIQLADSSPSSSPL
ncbi:hypothetical protein [Lentzea sp. NEAU-D7]|uniref:hypothetical protein n=1 Tax=Lentzea sp. NEAU-D7 TaxID=2994667 RepID=UPI00224B4F2D|nr:hypothetical protein [Lentzea sp. NEAU-D7]MCX2949973.1 hypothetical protein [Lentzea sp. NEAU-D7]